MAEETLEFRVCSAATMSKVSSISSWSGLDGLNKVYEGLWDGEGAGENMGAAMGETGAGEKVVIVVGGEGAGEKVVTTVDGATGNGSRSMEEFDVIFSTASPDIHRT